VGGHLNNRLIVTVEHWHARPRLAWGYPSRQVLLHTTNTTQHEEVTSASRDLFPYMLQIRRFLLLARIADNRIGNRMDLFELAFLSESLRAIEFRGALASSARRSLVQLFGEPLR
jgi:hypothetical protein